MIFRKNPLPLITIILIIGIVLVLQPRKKEVSKKREPVAKVAIVIDDLGYNLKDIEQIYNIKKPITLSILPNLPYSRKIAIEAAKKGYEVILHLPLESHKVDAPLEEGTIRVDMTKDEVLKNIDMTLDSVSGCRGVSNHMGSKATEDRVLMATILKELDRRGLYFLDSLVTNKSVCQTIADEVGIRFAKRDVYLDNINDTAYIKNQFQFLIKKAKRRGSSIGIGHDRGLTIATLTEEIPKAEEEGINFVFVSELVE